MQAFGSEHTIKSGFIKTSWLKVNSESDVEEEKTGNLYEHSLTDKTPSCVSGTASKPSCKVSKEDCCCVCGTEASAPPPPPSALPSCIVESPGLKPEEVEKLLKENEAKLRTDFEAQMEREINNLKDKFDMILHNEQVRASLMLCEAHRERKEKIRALETQLESKNLSGLMYVLCSERRKSKIEKMRLTQEYTSYILALQGILAEAQSLILRLSRGYKTASRLDQEWRDKMKSVVKENFVCHYEGGPPDMHQYLFDVPKLTQVEAPTEDDMLEDPCQDEDEDGEGEGEGEEGEVDEDLAWYKRLDSNNRPFVVYGDLADFQPPDRREVLKKLKAANADATKVPRKWKEYAFNEMFVKAVCPNMDAIKDEYLQYLPTEKWECHLNARTPDMTSTESSHHRMQSIADMKAHDMGSILKIITSAAAAHRKPSTKTMLLGARDSMEIASSTKLLKERKLSRESHHDPAKVVLDVKNRKASIFQDISEDDSSSSSSTRVVPEQGEQTEQDKEEDDDKAILGSIAHDSMVMLKHHHSPPGDATINYEKVCPVEECQKLKVDSFIRSLPPYMRASSFMHFEQTFEDYECCSPEQLEVLLRRIAEKKRATSEPEPHVDVQEVLSEWVGETPGVCTQTGEDEEKSEGDLPPCTCREPTAQQDELEGLIYNLVDLFPVKHTLDHIEQECLHNDNINFNRFKVLGQKGNGTERSNCGPEDGVKFKEDRLEEIKKILLKYPDLMDIFHSTPKC